MKQVINNEGKSVTINNSTYNAMQKDFNSGVWAVIVNDINGQPHSVILEANFNY